MLYQLTPVFYIKIKRKTSGNLYTDFEPCCPHNLFPSFTKLLTFVQYCYLQLDHGCQKLQTVVRVCLIRFCESRREAVININSLMHHGEFDGGIQPKECGIVQENHIIEIPTRV